MALSLNNLPVGTLAVVPLGTLAGGQSVTLINSGTNPVYVGLSTTVSTASGFLFPVGGQPVTWALPSSSSAEPLYAIAATGSTSISYAFASTA